MSRYTIIVIDHEEDDKAVMYESDTLGIPSNKGKSIVPIKTAKKPSMVYPDFEKASKLMSSTKSSSDSEVPKGLLNRKFKEVINKPQKRSPQEMFEKKLNAEKYDSFNANDLVCFFRYTANLKGIRYAINWSKDASHMKKLQESLSNMEIIAMVEFLFLSKQKYIDKKKLSVGIFTTNWLNTIYQDSQDWLEDKYEPAKDKEKKKKAREWKAEKPEEGTEATIGWE